jgi:hypothetical protein
MSLTIKSSRRAHEGATRPAEYVAELGGTLSSEEGASGEQGFGPSLARFISHGVYNGDFGQLPENPLEPIDDDNNPLPGFSFRRVSGSPDVLVDPSVAGGVRFEIRPGAAGDEAYLEQLVAIRPALKDAVALAFSAAVTPDGSPNLMKVTLALDVMDAPAGTSQPQFSDLSAVQQLVYVEGWSALTDYGAVQAAAMGVANTNRVQYLKPTADANLWVSYTGTTGAAEPDWVAGAVAGFVVDGTVTWMPCGLASEVWPPAVQTVSRLEALAVEFTAAHPSVPAWYLGFVAAVYPSPANGHIYWVSPNVSGTTAATQPAYPTDGSTVVDGNFTMVDGGGFAQSVVLGTATASNSATTVSLPAGMSRVAATLSATADGGTGSQPAYLRMRVGFKRDAEAAGASGSVYVTDVRLERKDLADAPDFATPAIVLGTAAAAGAASTVIRSDSTILAFDVTAPVTQAFADAAATGAAAVAARRDHKHGMPADPVAYAVPALTLGTANAAGAASSAVRTDATILAFDATDPSTQAFGDAAAVGAATVAPRRDHKHAMPAAPSAASVGAIASTIVNAKGDLISATADNTPSIVTVGADDTILMADAAAASGLKWVASASPSAVGTAAATGTADTFTRGDHVHAHEAAHVAHDTLWNAAGDLAVGSAADTAVRLAITVPAANILEVLGVVNGETTASWKAVHDGTAPSTQAFGDAAAAGTALTAAHRDHKHGMPADPGVPAFATPAVVLGTANAAGAAATVIRSDATIAAFDVTNPTTSAVGDAAAVGTATVAARRDHKHAREAFATNTIALGTAAAAGVATTLVRSDATILAFDATVPAAVGTAAAGVATTAARRDHVHPTGAGTPSTQAFGDAAAIGTGPNAAMEDHKHAMPQVYTGLSATESDQGTFTALTDLTSMTVTFTAVTGHTYLIMGHCLLQSSVANDGVLLAIREGSTTLETTYGPVGTPANHGITLTAMVYVQPSAAAHTYKLSAARDYGTGNITKKASATTPALIVAIDLG